MRAIENQNKDGASYKVIVANFWHRSSNRNSLKGFLGIIPKQMDPPPSALLGIKIWILAKFMDNNMNFMAKNNGHQNFT